MAGDGRLDVRHQALKWLCMVLIFSGCIPGKENSTGLIFPHKIHLTSVAPGEPALFVVPFSVTGTKPVVIDRVERSCTCTVVREGLLNSELQPGNQYELPITVSVGARDVFLETIRVGIAGGPVSEIKVGGIVNSPPRLIPPVVICNYTQGAIGANGEFEVRRSRLTTEAALIPKQMHYHGRLVRVSLKNTEQLPVKGLEMATTDSLKWTWEITEKPSPLATEELMIDWKESSIEPTRLLLKYEQSDLSGIPKELYCGKVASGSTVHKTFPLDATRFNGLSGVPSIEGSDGIDATIDRTGDILHLHVILNPQVKNGRFEGTVRLKFGTNVDREAAIRVSALVTP